MRLMNSKFACGAVALLSLASALGPALAAAPVRTAPNRPGPRVERPAVVTAAVLDVNPAEVLAGRTGTVGDPAHLGPFDAKTTMTVYVVAVYDRSRIGSAPFDQHVRLFLPDGNLYEDRVTPVDPQALPGATVRRADLGPDPVPLRVPARMLRMARSFGASRIPAAVMRDATYTSEPLAVSGTWITRHNLYGEWRAEVTMERDGQVVSKTTTTFRLDNGH